MGLIIGLSEVFLDVNESLLEIRSILYHPENNEDFTQKKHNIRFDIENNYLLHTSKLLLHCFYSRTTTY